MESAVLVLHHLHLTIHGEPVGMYVEEAHKDTYHDAFPMEILVLLHLFYHYHPAISRRHHEVVGVIGTKQAYRTAEKVEHNAPYRTKNHGKDVERHMAVE